MPINGPALYAYASTNDENGLYELDGGSSDEDGYIKTSENDNSGNSPGYDDPTVNSLFSTSNRNLRSHGRAVQLSSGPTRCQSPRPALTAPPPPGRPSLNDKFQFDETQPVYEPVPISKEPEPVSANTVRFLVIISVLSLIIAMAALFISVQTREAAEAGGQQHNESRLPEMLNFGSPSTEALADGLADASTNYQDPKSSNVPSDSPEELPPGAVQFFFTQTPLPSNWLVCNGSTYASSTWPMLAQALGNENDPTFTVPDMIDKGLFPRSSTVEDVGTVENSSVSASDISVTIVDPGHRHPENWQRNQIGKGFHTIDYSTYTNIADYNSNYAPVILKYYDNENAITISRKEYHTSNVSATVNAGIETRPAAIRLLPAIYAGRRGSV